MSARKDATAAGTRRRIVEKAYELALKDGMSSISFGVVAEALPMSKSGLFAHFGSKDQLLVDVVDLAEERFVQTVVEPSQQAAPGMRRLGALLYRFVDEAAGLDRGGRCFFCCAVHEIEAVGGAPRERFHGFVARFRDAIRDALDAAGAAGQVDAGVERDKFVFAVIGFGLATTWHAQLHGDPALARRLGREQVAATLRHIAVGAAAAEIPPVDG